MSVSVAAKTGPSAAGAKGAPATLPGFRDVTQIAVITVDANAAIRAIGAALGAGSFKVATLEPPALFNTTYDGAAEPFAMKVGVTWIGDMLVEVIQPLRGRNIFSDYLTARGGKAGVQHILLERSTATYDEAIETFAHAGYAPRQHGQLNADGRIGFVPLPAMPQFLANRYATRFCYANSHEAWKVDVELAKFPGGLSTRTGLRTVVAQEWIPAEGPKYFESLPPDAVLKNIDAIYVLTRDVVALASAYGKLADRALEVASYADDTLPGHGKTAEIKLAASSVFLVEPQSGPLRGLLAERGEGVQLARGRAKGRKPADALRGRGWAVEAHAKGAFATHGAVPFAIWVPAHGR